MDKIPIASAIRRFNRGGAICELYFDLVHSQFQVIYREVTEQYREQITPSRCTRVWLDHFIRDQTKLQPDSYHIAVPPDEAWANMLQNIVSLNQPQLS